MCFSLSDCQHPGQPRSHPEPQVRARGFLHEHSEHRAARAEVSHSQGVLQDSSCSQQGWEGFCVHSASLSAGFGVFASAGTAVGFGAT